MITITGAAGQLGSAIINFLINKEFDPSEITAVVGTEGKAQDLQRKGVNLKIGNYQVYLNPHPKELMLRNHV